MYKKLLIFGLLAAASACQDLTDRRANTKDGAGTQNSMQGPRNPPDQIPPSDGTNTANPTGTNTYGTGASGQMAPGANGALPSTPPTVVNPYEKQQNQPRNDNARNER